MLGVYHLLKILRPTLPQTFHYILLCFLLYYAFLDSLWNLYNSPDQSRLYEFCCHGCCVS
uniref:Uncharacterized protein n=1 Tax=Arundo donax TaxID=35708 RepID=A0A0A9GSB3_ARUDO